MNYKKIFVGLALFAIAALASWKVLSPSRTPLQNPFSRVQVVLNSGESIATYDGVLATTAFDALTAVAKDHNIPIETKQYDFGIFVEKIGNLAKTKDKAWIYYVSGVSGEVAADKKSVTDGDVVEWQYTKPIY